VYVVFEAPSDYVARCFAEYGLATDESGRFSALFRPYHLIGLELGTSIASVGLRREPTGAPRGWEADAVATAKRDLAAGEVLDGEGGFLVHGKLMPAAESRRRGALPIGLAHGVRLVRLVRAGEPVLAADVALDGRRRRSGAAGDGGAFMPARVSAAPSASGTRTAGVGRARAARSPTEAIRRQTDGAFEPAHCGEAVLEARLPARRSTTTLFGPIRWWCGPRCCAAPASAARS
jgi:hypothetical protein